MNSNSGISLEMWQQFLPMSHGCLPMNLSLWSPKLGQNGYDVLKGKSKEYHNIGRFDCKQQRIVHLFYFRSFTTIKPKNAGQAMYLEAISHPDISVVVVTGNAGTGKTFLSTVCGTILHELTLTCNSSQYHALLIFREPMAIFPVVLTKKSSRTLRRSKMH